LNFPGGLLIGDCAGFLNVPKIKGSHTAMKSGMCAAEAVFEELSHHSDEQQRNNLATKRLDTYTKNIHKSWLHEELHSVRNIRPAFKYGLYPGLAHAAFDTYILRGNAPWTFKNHDDHKQLLPANKCKNIIYPKPDGKLTFDRLSSVQLTNTFHTENQPCHLALKNIDVTIDVNYTKYASPEIRYCPAKVYEIVYTENEGQKQQQQQNSKQARLQINAQNCIHCKTCDIKDPTQNIVWEPPEGGGGPSYSDM
jgi:electron-transferring-flavoprotein dehydrogenase